MEALERSLCQKDFSKSAAGRIARPLRSSKPLMSTSPGGLSSVTNYESNVSIATLYLQEMSRTS